MTCQCTCAGQFLENQPGGCYLFVFVLGGGSVVQGLESESNSKCHAHCPWRGRAAERFSLHASPAGQQHLLYHLASRAEPDLCAPAAAPPAPAGFCPDPETGACTVVKEFKQDDRTYYCPGDPNNVNTAPEEPVAAAPVNPYEQAQTATCGEAAGGGMGCVVCLVAVGRW